MIYASGWSGRKQLLPALPRFTRSANGAAPDKRRTHSHSIVSGAYKQMKIRYFCRGAPDLPSDLPPINSAWGAIDGDRCREQFRQVDGSHRIEQQSQQIRIP